MRPPVAFRLRAIGIVLGLAGAVVAGCSALPGIAPEPAPCGATFSMDRCDAILAWAARQLGLAPSGIDRVDIVPAGPETPDPLGRGKTVNVRVHVPDGPSRDIVMQCFGVAGAWQAECMDEPQIVVRYPGDGSSGYRDTPVGAAPFPGLDPAAVAASQPLVIDHRTITIERAGPTRVVLGQAQLANGVIREASIELADAWPASVVILGSLTMDITPAGGGGPIWNIFEHGWHEGVELVEVSITFDAVIVHEGAGLELVNVVVR